MKDKNHSKNTSEPLSRDYAKQMKNKENQKSPYGDDEPSNHTTFK